MEFTSNHRISRLMTPAAPLPGAQDSFRATALFEGVRRCPLRSKNSKNSTLVIFARPGETTLNAETRIRGRAGPRLRARATERAIVQRTQLEPRVTSLLDDFDDGPWIGKTKAAAEWPELLPIESCT